MGKGGDVKRGGSSRFSAAMRQTEGGDNNGILDQSSKKEKLRKLSSVGEMGQSSQSTITNNSSKRVKLSNKVSDDFDTVNHASVPRKLRSAMKKRHYESVSLCSPNPRSGIRRFEMASKDRKRKLEVNVDERDSTMSGSIAEQITRDEEEVMAALVAMAGMFPGNDKTDETNLNNETSEAEASTLQEKDDSKTICEALTASKSEDMVQESSQMGNPNEATNTLDVKKDRKDVTDGNKSRKRCSSHVYICRLIKDLQVTKGKQVNSYNEPKQRAHVDVKPDTNPENITNGYADTTSNEARPAHKTLFQDQRHACGVEARSLAGAQSHANVPVTHLPAAASEQVPVPPYFGSPLYDPSQWLKPGFRKQQMWMNQFIPGARYQHWQHGGCETVPPHSGSYVGMSSSKHVQASLLDVLGSTDTRNIPQKLPYKMQFGHRSSGYDENGGLFLVDSSPTLKLTLQ